MHGSKNKVHENTKLKLIEECKSLRKTFIDFDLTINRKDWQPLVILERYWNRHDIKALQEELSVYKDLNVNTAIESFSYQKYISDVRYEHNLFAKLPVLDDTTGLLVFFPRQYNALSLTEDLQKFEPLTQISSVATNRIVQELQYFFQKNWPEYYMKFTPYGSLISGLGFSNSFLNVNIELDEPDLQRIIDVENSFIEDFSTPYCITTTSVLLREYGADKVQYETDINSVRLKLDPYYSIEYNFNKEIFTYSTNLINHYMTLDPRVPTFLYALKFFGRGRNIFASQIKCGVRYYGYTILALAYLSQLDPPVIPNLQHINYSGTDDTCNFKTCSSKKKYWDTVIFNGEKVGIAARYHDCVKYDPNIDKTEYYVQQNPLNGKSYWNSKNKSTVGHLFLDFLHYYGYRFDFKTYAVSLKFNGTTTKKSNWKNHDIAIEDPFMANTNLASLVLDGKKFIDVFKGSFSILQSGICFEVLYKKIQEITKINSPKGVNYDRPLHIPLPIWTQKATSKSFLLIGLPKSDSDNCYCDRINNLFSTHGKIEKMLNLDHETKQVFFTPDTGNATTIVLPNTFMLNGKNVHLVELHNFNV